MRTLSRSEPCQGQGTASMFTFGHATGVAEGSSEGLNIPYTLVTPQAWKKSAGLIGSDKDAARSRAIQLYPELRALDAKAKGQAIADALFNRKVRDRREIKILFDINVINNLYG